MILKINDRYFNRKVDFFTDFKMNMKYDAMSSNFTLGYDFDPDNAEHKEFSCVGHHHICTLEDNNELLMTCYILSQGFADTPEPELAVINGYSLAGILEDCEIPPGKTLESNLLTLNEIAQKFIEPFGLQMVVDSSASQAMNEPFEVNDAKETESIKSFLSKLASQKNIIISHDQFGRIIFVKPTKNKKPIFDFVRGIPGVTYKLTYNGKGMHSVITAIQDANDDDIASNASVNNPYCPIVFRPHVIIQNSGTSNDTEAAVQNALQQELKNLTLTIGLDRWTLNDKIVRPGELITCFNPKVYLYNKSTWMIEEIDFTGDSQKQTATLKCVLPEVFTGGTPVNIFKGINIHFKG